MEKEKIYIGIDPDTIKNGVAAWYPKVKKLELLNLSFFDLQDFILDCNHKYTVTVIIDAGWLNGSNFHIKLIGSNIPKDKSLRIAAQIGERTGANHETGKKIAEMCVHHNVNYKLHKPTKKKLNDVQFKSITKYSGRTNQETRDAAMLVYGMA